MPDAPKPSNPRFQRPPVRRRKPSVAEAEVEKKEEEVPERPATEEPKAALEEDKSIADLGEEMIKSLLTGEAKAETDGEFKTDL